MTLHEIAKVVGYGLGVLLALRLIWLDRTRQRQREQPPTGVLESAWDEFHDFVPGQRIRVNVELPRPPWRKLLRRRARCEDRDYICLAGGDPKFSSWVRIYRAP